MKQFRADGYDLAWELNRLRGHASGAEAFCEIATGMRSGWLATASTGGQSRVK